MDVKWEYLPLGGQVISSKLLDVKWEKLPLGGQLLVVQWKVHWVAIAISWTLSGNIIHLVAKLLMLAKRVSYPPPVRLLRCESILGHKVSTRSKFGT